MITSSSSYQPQLLGVINLSPESMVTGSIVQTTDELLARADVLRHQGVGIFDLGGRSITPDAPPIDDATEWARIAPAIETLLEKGFDVSVDTWSETTAREALARGARTINFTGEVTSDALLREIARAHARLILTYMPYGNAYLMREKKIATYQWNQLEAFFKSRITRAKDCGIEEVIIDPNLGIVPPTVSDERKIHVQLDILRQTDQLRALGCPLLYYAARKPERLARIMMASAVLHARPEYIRTHEPAILQSLLQVDREIRP